MTTGRRGNPAATAPRGSRRGRSAWYGPAKGSYSNARGGDCVDVAPGIVPVLGSERAEDGPVLLFATATWAAFLPAVKH
ncbi:DUF397 domain-containing protein [Streptomyces sp. NPDC003393]